MKPRVMMVLFLCFPTLASATSITDKLPLEDVVSCMYSYGAILEAAQTAKHEGMAKWARDRIAILLPLLQAKSGEPDADRRARSEARAVREDNADIQRQATLALREENVGKMRELIGRRTALCDTFINMKTYSLPMAPNPKHFTAYERGYRAACIDVQQRANQDHIISDQQINIYCYCQTATLAIDGIDERTPLDVAKAHADQTRESCRRLALDDRT